MFNWYNRTLLNAWSIKIHGSSKITCQLGTPVQRNATAWFRDDHGHKIRVVTDLMNITAETIAEIYKARWEVGTFFRWIKQHLNIPVLFGTTANAVYGQLYAALIT